MRIYKEDVHPKPASLMFSLSIVIVDGRLLMKQMDNCVFFVIHSQEYCITSDEALSLEKFPKKIVVMGGG